MSIDIILSVRTDGGRLSKSGEGSSVAKASAN
jgi:hypothetical protein